MKKVKFDELVSDVTSEFHKVKKENYLNEGYFPIIDQGQIFIGGYTNDKTVVSTEVAPYVLFGDHTKIT